MKKLIIIIFLLFAQTYLFSQKFADNKYYLIDSFDFSSLTKEDKILLRSIYYVNAGKMGYQTFKLLVYARGLSAKFEKDFFSFARLQPQVVFFVSNFGSWDFELTVEADSPKMAVAVTERIYEKFSTNVQEIRILPVFKQTTSSGFLKL